jgi:hypothetical protein
MSLNVVLRNSIRIVVVCLIFKQLTPGANPTTFEFAATTPAL